MRSAASRNRILKRKRGNDHIVYWIIIAVVLIYIFIIWHVLSTEELHGGDAELHQHSQEMASYLIEGMPKVTKKPNVMQDLSLLRGGIV
jgi:hypothetical protein